jgi:diguanylate cyclase (GGDEF)-like protein
MSSRKSLLSRLTHPHITDERELARYVVRITAIALSIALILDVINQLIFFEGWWRSFRSWMVTTAIVSIIAVPITRAIGQAHLELYRAKVEVDHLSRTDVLTSLPNRRALIEAGEAGASRLMVLVIVDVDRFKRVNDTHGHRVGDIVLQFIARCMAAELAEFGVVGRLGGEEFALVSNEASPDAVVAALAAFRKRISVTPVVTNGAAVAVTISAGAAILQPGKSMSDLYSEADGALYAAKADGRNRIVLTGELRALCSPKTLSLTRGLDSGIA